MGKAEIENWIASTANGSDEYDDPTRPGLPEWYRETVLTDWTQALQVAQKRLLTSSTKSRIQFLKEEILFLAKHADLSLSQTLDIFKLLTQTYVRYVDTPSREAVEEVGIELVHQDELRQQPLGVTEQILGWLANEVSQFAKRPGGFAPSDIFVLLSWSTGLYTELLKTNPDFPSTSPWRALIGTIAILLDLLLDSSSHAKPAVRKSSIARVRRALRSSPANLSKVMDTIVTNAKSSSSPLAMVPLLGMSVDVTLRLKHQKDESLTQVQSETKDKILNFYNTSVLMSKKPVPTHISSALHDFIKTYVTETDLTTSVLPTIEKSLLRSPEISLSVIAEFFSAYTHPIGGELFRKLLTSILNNAKSTNPIVRTNAAQLFRVIIAKISSSEDLEYTLTELLSLPKAGKTAGPDHRVALYTMVSYLAPSATVSPKVTQAIPSLLAKETHDTAVSILASGFDSHITFCLRKDIAVPADAVTLIVKEMGNTKPAIRRAFFSVAGSAIWNLGDLSTPAAHKFAHDVLPALDNSLKTVSGNPLSAPAGPLEGYIAVALLLGPYSRSGKFDDAISKTVALQNLSTTGVKPSFLIWDKVYQKLATTDEEAWLLRASEKALITSKTQLLQNEQAAAMFGSIFLHLAVESSSPDLRRSVNVALAQLASEEPEALIRSASAAISSFLTKSKQQSNEEQVITTRSSRLVAFLLACASFGENTDKQFREQILVDLIVLAHHPILCPNSRPTWIELCQAARVDPHELVTSHTESVLSAVFNACDVVSQSFNSAFLEAAYRAVTTIAFVAPEAVVARVIEHLNVDLKSDDVEALTDEDFGIWVTPEGTAFVDVLAGKKQPEFEKKGKGAKDAQWEAEVRQSLANKKKAAGTPVLSKQDAALVDAQLKKEAIIRERVNSMKARLERGLQLIHSLVSAQVEELKKHLSTVVDLLLIGGFGKAVRLVGSTAFDRYLDLSSASSDRLDTFKKWVGVASLRSLNVQGIPDELQVEPVNSLVLRVLYRLRTLSEQTPFDSATYSYAYPLLSQVLVTGGVGLTEEDDPLEQIMLSLQIVRFHCGEFFDPVFPRKRTIDDLLHAIRHQPKLAKEASSALVELGQAMHSNAARDEIDVLLEGCLSQEVYVRNACLQTLQPFDLTDMDWSPKLWIVYHDHDEQNARLAQHLWDDNGLDVPQAFLQDTLPYLEHDHAYVRSSSGSALADCVEQYPSSISSVLEALEEFYREKAKVLAPEFDQYGMLVASSIDRADPWPTRLAISGALELLAPHFTEDTVVPLFKFLIHDEGLGDRHPDVRRAMLQAGTAVIDSHGPSRLAELISMFEKYLASPSSSSNETSDYIKEAVVILFGRVARHLDPADTRIPQIVKRLVEALKTPSEQVQIAVSDCLSPLVKIQRSTVPSLVDQLFEELLIAPKYAARRGAAYGLAGIIKGAGISTMKEFDVIERLRAATEDKKRYEARQGALFAFECFSSVLGRLFEPYVLHILPLLLTSFGDATSDVRESTHDAARVIMGNLSGYGVKSILPSLLEGLDDKQWRSKKGSIELLGMMAYCAPRQLSQSLPVVIPRLTGVLTDSHAQVRVAANKSLKQFGEVISNPEIQSLVPVFLKALVDPAKTPNALSALLKTSFAHYIDHSSLALVVPIIERGLRERSADTKKKAAQIVGNLASLTDSKDFVPYLSELLPHVHVVLVDPVPEARATAAKSLGTLVERLGEGHFPDLVPGLLRTLKADVSGVDRQGAAQGLSEVLAGLGMERMEGLLPDIIANAQAPRSTVREGFMSLLVYLPATFGTRFSPHLPKIITPILSGLSDSEDYVREAAMRAGRMIVTNYSNKAIDLLLPELERGMFDPGWRIRQSSITLVGELLFKVSGISGKAEIEEDEEVVETAMAESSRKVLIDVLGVERRDRILSALYLARQDSVNVVRQSSIHIWKALVHNTPRTVREILPELMTQIIALLSSSEPDQNETAARTVAELCRKSGEKILGEVIGILRSKTTSTDPRTREGVCLMLCELLESTTDAQREDHEDAVITMVRISLVDDEANVRSGAAKAFDILQEQVGAKAIDQTIPTLLEALRQPGQSSGTALQALREVMSVRASTVFPVLIPTLTASPMTVFNARALASLVTVAGSALSRRLNVILNALVKELEGQSKSEESELKTALEEALHALLQSICDAEGLHTLMLLLLDWAKHDSINRRVSACNLLAIFCEESEMDHSLYRVDWIRQLVSLLDDHQVAVHTAAWKAFDSFAKSVPKDELEPLVVPLRRTIESTGAPGIFVPGFSLPKGVSPAVPIIIAGLTTGSNEQRENAAYAIGDLVERTEDSAIKPFVVPFTGPLIRVATQATTYPPGVKVAILTALSTMLERIPAFVKPFFPQLQRTFVKSATDSSSLAVRTKAAQALGILMKNQPRVDPVITELLTGVKNNEDVIAASLIQALTYVVRNADSNIGEKAREACVELVSDAFKDVHEEPFLQAIASLFAALSSHAELLKPIVDSHLVAGTPPSVLASHCIVAVLSPGHDGEYNATTLFHSLAVVPQVSSKVQESIGNEKPSISRPAREAKELLKNYES